MSKSETMDLSDKWKWRFEVLSKIGANNKFITKAQQSEEYKALPFGHRIKLSFNIFAFLFGPFYYFFKGMWAKGFALLGIIWLIQALLVFLWNVMGEEISPSTLMIPGSLLCCQLANYDYFKKTICDEKMWEAFPSLFSKSIGMIGFPLLAFILLNVISIYGIGS